MAAPTRRRSAGPPIISAHFELLQTFGRNKLARNASDDHREKFWRMCCEAGRVPYVPHERVVEEWKQFITARSNHSSLAINADIDPDYTSLAVCYKKLMVAGHTTKTRSLLIRVLQIFSRSFDGREAFLNAIEKLAKRVSYERFGGPPPGEKAQEKEAS